MIITLITIVGTSVGLIIGSLTGYIIGNRRRTNREMEEDFETIINYYTVEEPNDIIN